LRLGLRLEGDIKLVMATVRAFLGEGEQRDTGLMMVGVEGDLRFLRMEGGLPREFRRRVVFGVAGEKAEPMEEKRGENELIPGEENGNSEKLKLFNPSECGVEGA